MLLDRRHFLGGTAALSLTHALPAIAATPADAQAMTLLDATAEALLTEYPENALYLGIDTGKRAALRSRLNDRSVEGDQRRRTAAATRLADLERLDLSRLSADTRVHVEVTKAAHALALDGWKRLPVGDVAILNNNVSYRSTPYIVSQGSGAYAEVPDLLDSKHTVETREDAEAYLARLEAYAVALDQETPRIGADAAAGTVLPGFLNDITVGQMTGVATQAPEEWGLVKGLGTKAKTAGLDGGWDTRAAKIIADKVAPALQRQIAALKAVRPKASDAPGMWQIPGAADRYQWLVEAGTTTKRTAEDIHQDGLEQCKALAAQMDPLLRAQGLTRGTVGERLATLGKRPDLLFANTDAGRAQVLEYLNGIVAKIRPRLPRAFGKIVPGNLQIRRVPGEIQDGAPNGYAGPGSLDGKKPGTYYINLKDVGIWPRFALPTLTFHEGIPGHIWQGEYTFSLPLIRTLLSFNAYSEGWGLYAEQLGDELGFYDDDPLGRIGYLQSMNFRAARLVADTGLHHKRWTMPQAMAWFMATTGFTASQARSELNRYCAWPGQALGYKTGHNEINRLRTAAKAAMGARFDMRAFDDLVVQTGGVPLGVLGDVVGRWQGAKA